MGDSRGEEGDVVGAADDGDAECNSGVITEDDPRSVAFQGWNFSKDVTGRFPAAHLLARSLSLQTSQSPFRRWGTSMPG